MTDLYAAITKALAPKPELPALPEYYLSLKYFLERMTEYNEWRDILREYYPGAVKVVVETTSEYNDEGYSDHIEEVHAYDYAGNNVPFTVEGVTDEEELADVWSEKRYDWLIPSCREIDLDNPPVSPYWTREAYKAIAANIGTYLDQLPDHIFKTEE